MKPLRRNAFGRVRTPMAKRVEFLDEFEGSGLSRIGFVELAGIMYPRFVNWIQRRRRKCRAYRSKSPVQEVRFLEAVVSRAVS
jgi:hypothetical protein